MTLWVCVHDVWISLTHVVRDERAGSVSRAPQRAADSPFAVAGGARRSKTFSVTSAQAEDTASFDLSSV